MNDLLRQISIALRGMWNHRWPALATSWGVGVLALGLLMSIPAKYEASARIFVNTDSILKPLMTGLTVQPNEDQRIIMLSRVVISRPNVERLVRTVGLDSQAETPAERERVIDNVIRTLEFKGAGRDNLYSLTFRDVDARRAKEAVEILANMFIESSRGGKEQDTDTAKKFIEDQIAVYEKKLQEAEERLKDFRLRNLGIAPSDGRDYFARMNEVSNQLNQARLELREAQNSRDSLRRRLEAEGVNSFSSGGPSGGEDTAALLAEIDGRIDAMRRNLDALLQRFTESHPDVVGAQRVIRELQEQRRQVVAKRRPGESIASASTLAGPRATETIKVQLAQAESSVASLSIRVAEYSSRYERLKGAAAQVPALEAEYAQLNRDYDVNKRNYESLVTRRESANISGEMQTVAGVSDFRLVDPPRVSPRPVSPKQIFFPLALVAALSAGLGVAYVTSQARPTFYDARSLRDATGLPLLGVVSIIVSDKLKSAERRDALRFSGGVAALVVTFGACVIAFEFLALRSV